MKAASRWPCHRCGHDDRRFTLVCPECEALPWREAPPITSLAGRLLERGVTIEIKSEGWLRLKHRFSTLKGFLGSLTRRFFGGADWLGIDGREWRIARAAPLTRTRFLWDEGTPVAAAQIDRWRGAARLYQGDDRYVLRREGVLRSDYLLALDSGSEPTPVARLHGGLLDPVRSIEVLQKTPVAILVLASYFASRLRSVETEE